MRAGKLDRVVAIQSATQTVNDYGTPVATWGPVATLRAEVIQQGTEEAIRGGAVAETVIVFRTRYLAGITTAHRVSFEGRGFNIKDVVELGRRDGLELRCTAVEGET